MGAGMLAGAALAAVFGVLVIWLNTNQYATGLALSLFGGGFSAFGADGFGHIDAVIANGVASPANGNQMVTYKPPRMTYGGVRVTF